MLTSCSCNVEQKNSLKKWKIYLFRYLLTFSVKFIIVRMNFNCKNASVNMQNYKLQNNVKYTKVKSQY